MSAHALLACGPLLLDVERREVSCGDVVAHLWRQEAVVLACLMRRPGSMVLRDTLLAALYPDPDLEPGDAAGVLKVIVSRLRRLIASMGVVMEIRWMDQGWIVAGERRLVRSYSADEARVADAAVLAWREGTE